MKTVNEFNQKLNLWIGQWEGFIQKHQYSVRGKCVRKIIEQLKNDILNGNVSNMEGLKRFCENLMNIFPDDSVRGNTAHFLIFDLKTWIKDLDINVSDFSQKEMDAIKTKIR